MKLSCLEQQLLHGIHRIHLRPGRSSSETSTGKESARLAGPGYGSSQRSTARRLPCLCTGGRSWPRHFDALVSCWHGGKLAVVCRLWGAPGEFFKFGECGCGRGASVLCNILSLLSHTRRALIRSLLPPPPSISSTSSSSPSCRRLPRLTGASCPRRSFLVSFLICIGRQPFTLSRPSTTFF